MSRPWLFSALLALASCSVSLEPPEDARILCGRNNACPDGFECAEGLGYCVNAGTVIPALQVAFTLPRNGDDEVALNLAGVVVLNMDAKLPEDGIITLESEDGLHDVPLVVSVAGAPNTLIIEAQGLLYPLTHYVLTVNPGIAPADGLLAVPSTESWSATFKTADSSDITPPEPVTNLVVDAATSIVGVHTLTWTPSVATDIAGLLVLRRSGSANVDGPSDGVSYAGGQTIGASTVANVGVANDFTDLSQDNNPRYYGVFVFDTALNYSPMAAPPVGTLADVLWCPDHVGHFHITSPDAGEARLHATTSAGASFGSGTLVPLAGDIAFGAEGTFAGGAAPFTIGSDVWLRPVAKDGDATYVGVEQQLHLSNVDLQVLAHHSELNVATEFPFSKQAWPDFEAEADTDPTANVEAWVSATVDAPIAGGGNVIAAFTQAGTYRVRVRPVVPGCAAAPWSTSGQFFVGTSDYLYVKAGSTGGGGAPGDPAGSLQSVYVASTSATAILVAEGTYDEPIILKEGVEYYGGYTADFMPGNRDPLVHASTFTQPYFVIDATDATVSTVVDGFHLVATATTPGTHGETPAAVHLFGASPTISHNVITTARNAWYNAGVDTSIGSPIISHNRITSNIAVWVQSGAPVVEDNEQLLGGSYQRAVVNCVSGSLTLRGNTIIKDLQNPQQGDSHTVQIDGDCIADIIGNTIASTSPATFAQFSSAIDVRWGEARIINNDIYGGFGPSSVGILLQPTINASDSNYYGPITISNNTIHAGEGTDTNFFGDTRVGIAIDGRSHPAPWTVRITNNLIFGAGNYLAFALDSDFLGIESVENNVVIYDSAGSAQASFLRTFSSSSAPSAPISLVDAESLYCDGGHPFPFTDNQLIDTSFASVFDDLDGVDNVVSTAADNDWDLKTTAPTAVKNGGLTLDNGINCGGTGCTGGNNAICGVVTDDIDGVSRSDPYSVGAHESP